MTICVGACLVDDGENPVYVQVASTWGGAGLGFAGADNLGAPVYCSADGLRTVPEHTSSVFADSASTSPGSGFAANEVFGVSRTLTLSNPSAVRSCHFLLVFRVKFTITITATNFAYAIIVNINGGGDLTHEAALWGVPSAESYNHEMQLCDSYTAAIAPGGTYEIVVKPKIDATAGGSGTLANQTIRSEAILVTV